MRHGKKFNHLSRTAPHRKAMLTNMAASLIKHKRINTTLAKAKALRVFVEPILTKSKEDTTNNRRQAFASLQDKYAVSELFREIAPKIAERNGGYTRIIKTGFRLGDGAETAMIELVDFNELYSTSEGKKTRRSRRSRKSADSTADTPASNTNEAKAGDSAKGTPPADAPGEDVTDASAENQNSEASGEE